MDIVTTLFLLFLFGREQNLCQNLYWDTRYNSDAIVVELCTPVWDDYFNNK